MNKEPAPEETKPRWPNTLAAVGAVAMGTALVFGIAYGIDHQAFANIIPDVVNTVFDINAPVAGR